MPSNVSAVILEVGGKRKKLVPKKGWVLATDRAAMIDRADTFYLPLGYTTIEGQEYQGEAPHPPTDRKPVDSEFLTGLSDCRHWVWAAQRQIERFVLAFHEDAEQHPRWLPTTPAQMRHSSLTYTEAEFLLNAANHVLTSLSRMTNGPRLSEGLTFKIKHLRNLHEHWDEQRSSFAHRDSPKKLSGKSFSSMFPDAKPWTYSWGSDGHTISVLRLEDLWAELDAVDRSLAKLSDEALMGSGIPHVPEGDLLPRPFPYAESDPRPGSIVAMSTRTQNVIIGDPSDRV